MNKIRFERERFKAKRSHPSMSFSAVGKIETEKIIATDLQKDVYNNANKKLNEHEKQLLLNTVA